MKHLSNDDKDHPNQQENSHKLCDEEGHPAFGFKESCYSGLRNVSP